MKKIDNKGFTLIELLVIIVLISLVMGISFFAIRSSIQKAKENTYKTTINNIESEANNYLLENSNRLFFISDDANQVEYQCITVRNLIDMGYFDSTITKSEIANDRKVKESDYIYIEKNLVSKAVTKEEFVMDTNEALVEKCAKVIGATRDIEFIIPDGYSREKEIIITYKLKNINDINEYSNYSYLYSYPVNEIEGTVTSGNTVKVKVTENGELTGKIVYNGNNTSIEREYVESVNVTGIDKTGPVISLGSYTSGYVKDKVTIPFKVVDNGIGVDYNSFTKDDIIVTIDGNAVSNITLENKGSGNYNLIINNTEYNGKVIIDIEANKVLDKLDNGNEAVSLKPNITFDNETPVCRLKVTTSGVSFDEKSDNNSVSSFGISKDTTASYDGNTTLSLSTGTIYGYVKDSAGNTGSCSAIIDDVQVSKYDAVKKTCNYKVSSYECRTAATTYYNKSVRSCLRKISNYTRKTYSCRVSSYTKTTYTCNKTNLFSYGFSSLSSIVSSCVSSSSFTCNKANSGKSYTTCTKNYAFSESTTTASSCSESSSFLCNASKAGSSYRTCQANYNYYFGSWIFQSSGNLVCQSNSIGSCNKDNYSKSETKCEEDNKCSIGGTYDPGSHALPCVLRNQSSCDTSKGWQYAKTNYSASFSEKTESVNSCTVGSSISCSDSSHNGNSYISKCTPTEYSCSSGYTKVNDSYCYKINN